MCFSAGESDTTQNTAALNWIDEIQAEKKTSLLNKDEKDDNANVERKGRARPLSGRRALGKNTIYCAPKLGSARKDVDITQMESHPTDSAPKHRPVDDVLDSISFFQRNQVSHLHRL